MQFDTRGYREGEVPALHTRQQIEGDVLCVGSVDNHLRDPVRTFRLLAHRRLDPVV